MPPDMLKPPPPELLCVIDIIIPDSLPLSILLICSHSSMFSIVIRVSESVIRLSTFDSAKNRPASVYAAITCLSSMRVQCIEMKVFVYCRLMSRAVDTALRLWLF